MTTVTTATTALDLTPLRDRLIGLLEDDNFQPDAASQAFSRLRVEDPDYCGPDPQPYIAALTQRLVDRGIDVRHDTSVLDRLKFPADVWGATIPIGVSLRFPRTTVVMREGMPPRGTLLTLAHEGGHALTATAPNILDVFSAMLTAAVVGGHPDKEVEAEMVAYLVGAATGIMPDPTLSANYVFGWLAAAVRVGMDAHEVWSRQSESARKSAAILLGMSR